MEGGKKKKEEEATRLLSSSQSGHLSAWPAYLMDAKVGIRVKVVVA